MFRSGKEMVSLSSGNDMDKSQIGSKEGRKKLRYIFRMTFPPFGFLLEYQACQWNSKLSLLCIGPTRHPSLTFHGRSKYHRLTFSLATWDSQHWSNNTLELTHRVYKIVQANLIFICTVQYALPVRFIKHILCIKHSGLWILGLGYSKINKNYSFLDECMFQQSRQNYKQINRGM